jgi:hypothetical protein
VGRFAAGADAPLPAELRGGEGGPRGVAAAMLRAADNADAEARLRAALEHEARCQPEEESDSDDDEDAAADMDADDGMIDDEDEDGGPGDEARAAAGSDAAEARAERLAAFGRVMRERFLAGGEAAAHVDYAAVDADATLDERWARVADADAEDAYFDAQAP